MATEREREQSVASLVSGIVGDAQDLVRQEIALARHEIREEIRTAKDVGIAFAIAGVVLGIGAVLLMLALAQGIADLLDWPAWAGYALVGGVLAISGYIMLSSAQNRMKEIN